MSNETANNNHIFTEAPASITIGFSPRGVDIRFTMRAPKMSALLAGLDKLLETLEAQGWPPAKALIIAGLEAQPSSQPALAAQPTLSNGQPDPALCPIHQCSMARREKDGQVWFSHKVPDGTWCKGKPPKNNKNNSDPESQPIPLPSRWCSTHDVEMKLRRKNGQSWYSHKTPAGQWCRGPEIEYMDVA